MFLKTNILKAIAFKNPVRLPLSYWILAFLRFVLTLLPQSGYIHPDEFFQNVEVISGDIFMIDVARTWEFNPKFPIHIEMLKISWDNWVVTPLNFLRYNSDLKNLNTHGLHPRWLHVAVNIPLLFNVLGVMAFSILLIQAYRFIRGQYSKLPKVQSITGLMLFSLIIPVAVLSLFPHQEARFIIPVLTPLVYLYGSHFYPNDSDGIKFKRLKKTLLYVWYALNIILTVFFGFIHQGGLYPFARNLHREIKSMYGYHFHVITTHSYSIPTFLLQLESTSKIYKDNKTGQTYRLAPTTFIHKYGSMPMKHLFTKVNDVFTNAELLLHKRKRQYRFYIASPCSLEYEMRQEANKYNMIQVTKDITYYPHFSSEAFPEFPNIHDQFCLENNSIQTNQSQAVDLNMLQRISCFLKKFCLRVYRVSPTIKS
ncbi:jg13583 [Pararge aegeria aegeria]|uniref:Mannosyltransferase n=1 Tax=Pararge aegeria aegeria TaxID=348720 RepID=A0A8S4QWK1_9NEOP|nr:jg13583 [Pararge aegeria aegeria]